MFYFIYLSLAILDLCLLRPGFSLVVASGGCSLVAMHGASRCGGFSCCGAWFEVSRLQLLWCMGLVGPWDVESSLTRDRTCVLCACRQILNHWTTREVWKPCFVIPFIWFIWNIGKFILTESRLVVDGGWGGRGMLMDINCFSGVWGIFFGGKMLKMFRYYIGWLLYNLLNILKPIEIYSFKKWILCMVVVV